MKRIDRFYALAVVIALICLCLMLDSYASAEDAKPSPCAGDIEKFCKDVKPGAVMDCLEEHESELSDTCKAYEEKIGGKKVEMREEVRLMKIFRDVCKDEMAKFCGNGSHERSGIEKCLSAHESELSVPCRGRLNAIREERVKAKTK